MLQLQASESPKSKVEWRKNESTVAFRTFRTFDPMF